MWWEREYSCLANWTHFEHTSAFPQWSQTFAFNYIVSRKHVWKREGLQNYRMSAGRIHGRLRCNGSIIGMDVHGANTNTCKDIISYRLMYQEPDPVIFQRECNVCWIWEMCLTEYWFFFNRRVLVYSIRQVFKIQALRFNPIYFSSLQLYINISDKNDTGYSQQSTATCTTKETKENKDKLNTHTYKN